MDYGCARSFISLHFRCIVAGPAALAILTTAALQLQFYGLQLPCSFISLHFQLWLVLLLQLSGLWTTAALQLQPSGLQLPCGFGSLDYSCPAATALWTTTALAVSSRFICDVLWLLLQPQLSRTQLPCSLRSLDYSCSCGLSSLDDSCPASSVPLITAAFRTNHFY